MPNSDAPSWQVKLGGQIKATRLARNYRQKRLADVLGVRREMVRLYEKGEVAPTLAALRIIAQELRTTFSVDGIEVPQPSESAAAPQEVGKQVAFDFDTSYANASVRISASGSKFELIGLVPEKAVNE